MVSYKDLGLVNTREMFAKAIKENFNVPCALPDETDRSKVTPAKILKKIAKRVTWNLRLLSGNGA